MRCKTAGELYDVIERIAPFSTQCEWDNSGLLVGSADSEVNRIGVVLDITVEAIEKARSLGIDTIVGHHPVIFRPISNIPVGSPVYLLIKYGMTAVCSHTPLDKSIGGVNDALAAKLGFTGAAPLFSVGDEAMVRAAEIPETDAVSLAKYVAQRLDTTVALADGGNRIKKVAFCGGAGRDFINASIDAGCDAYITGEIKHNEFIESKERGFTVIEAGHFATENPVVEALAARLREEIENEVIVIGQEAPEKYIK